MTDQEKQKAISVAFAASIIIKPYHANIETMRAKIVIDYDSWLLTEEGKRLTAEEAEPEFDRFLVCGPKKKKPLDISKVGKKPDFITSVEQAYMDRMITTLQKKWHLNYKQARDIGRDLFYSFVLPVYELGGQYGLKPTAQEPEEPAINVLFKISKQLDRIEGNMKVVISDDLLKK